MSVLCRSRLALAIALLAVGCSKPAAPEGVTALAMADPREHWAKEGFVQLVPPIHMPSSDLQRDQVEIWARLPEGSTVTKQVSPNGSPVGLLFPPGSMLDRVEYGYIGGKRYVVDVRGTRIDEAGAQWFHVYRRDASGLFGYEWARADGAAHERATDALIDRLSATHNTKNSDGETVRPAWIDAVRRKNACAACHPPSRLTNDRQGAHGLVNRGTDASGFFTPWTVFENEIPLERYGGHDRSETDGYTEVVCPAGDTRTQTEGGRARCASGAVPRGRYDLAAARAAGDPRALKICTARRYLVAHLSPDLRQGFAAALQQCEDSSVTDPGTPG
ncbi:MAG: hypothetical protein JKY37_07980 [Nannocystaceae bacterium]|nr:hypothetical protein [Nannocystaceae bacterium]